MRLAIGRGIATVTAAALALSGLVSVAVAADPLVPGSATINGGALYTNTATVTVATPATNAVSMRLSNDGITYKTLAWAASTTWDLTDPAYGGSSDIESKSVHVQFDDGSDTWNEAWMAYPPQIYYDTQAPTESGMRVAVKDGSQINGGKVRMQIFWMNDDHAQSGSKSYDIEIRTDGGAWVPLSVHPNLPGLLQDLATGHTHQARVRAHDYAGNVSDWYTGPTFKVTVYQEGSSKLTWKGGWARTTAASYWGGHAKSSNTPGAKATFTFTGRQVALVARMGPKRGFATVWMNGTPIGAATLRAASSSYRKVVFAKSWTTSATRSVKFKVMSVPGGKWVDIDAVLVLN